MDEPNANSSQPQDLPKQYNVDRVVVMPRDPQWLYAYWEITPDTRAAALAELGVSAEEVAAALHVHDVTDRIDPDSGRPELDGAEDYVTIEVAPSADHWYFKVDRPDRLYCVEYVAVAPDGGTFSLAASNIAATPSDRVRDVGDETWVTRAPTGETARPPDAPAVRPAPPPPDADQPAEAKWLEGEDTAHGTLSSPGRAASSSDLPPGASS